MAACCEGVFGVVDQPYGLAGVAADRLALRLDGIEPGEEFGGGWRPARVGPGGA